MRTYVLFLVLAFVASPSAFCSCQWAVLPGAVAVLGTVGSLAPARASTTSGVYNLDTSGDNGGGIFFGNPGSEVTIKRAGETWTVGKFFEDWPSVNFPGVGIWSCPGDSWMIASHNFAPKPDVDFVDLFPTPLVAANAICTRIWLCDPRGIWGGFNAPEWFKASAGGQDALWMAKGTPVVNVYGDFGSEATSWSVKGWPVGYRNGGSPNYNFVSVISISAVFPCDMMKDFFLPAALLSISPNDDGSVKLSWDGNWGCRPPSSRSFIR